MPLRNYLGKRITLWLPDANILSQDSSQKTVPPNQKIPLEITKDVSKLRSSLTYDQIGFQETPYEYFWLLKVTIYILYWVWLTYRSFWKDWATLADNFDFFEFSRLFSNFCHFPRNLLHILYRFRASPQTLKSTFYFERFLRLKMEILSICSLKSLTTYTSTSRIDIV